MGHLFIGTSGYNYPDWKGLFYPKELSQKNWLSYYAKAFQTVEINNSFYIAIKPDMYRKWYEQTPDSFVFSVKGHRFITQMKKLHAVEDAVNRFFGSVSGLKEKLQVVLWQFPVHFHRNEETEKRLSTFLKLLPRNVQHAFEFRHTSWLGKEVIALLQQYNAALVLAESGQYPLLEKQTAIWTYIRFHGPGKLYDSEYSEEQMKQWAKKIKERQTRGDVYVYFNNDYHGHALTNIKMLKSYL